MPKYRTYIIWCNLERKKSIVQSRCCIHEGLNINSTSSQNRYSVCSPASQRRTDTFWPHGDVARLTVLLKYAATWYHHLPYWLNKVGPVINVSLKCENCFLKLCQHQPLKEIGHAKSLICFASLSVSDFCCSLKWSAVWILPSMSNKMI